MPQFLDLDKEFKPIKATTVSELANDDFVLRFKKEEQSKKAKVVKKLNYTFNIKMRPKQAPQSGGLQHETASPTKKRMLLMDKQGADGYLAQKRRSSRKNRQKHTLLVPMDEEYRLKALATLSDMAGFDASQPIELDSMGNESAEEVFVDAPENFREVVYSLSMEEGSSDEDVAEAKQTSASKQEEAITAVEPEKVVSKVSESPLLDHDAHPKLQPAPNADEYSDEDITLMRKTILSRLNGNTFSPIENLSLAKPFAEVYGIFERTVKDSESHTFLVAGTPGLGKTLIVNLALKKLESEHPSEFITIRLSGSLHSTEQHAIREMGRQLDLYVPGETSFEQRAISDTFNNILLTLYNENDNTASSIRIIIVIDEFEKFTDTPKQTLLYNLCELCQQSKVPICLAGVTCRITIRDQFEKRVRSRFSQRLVSTRKPSEIGGFWSDIKQVLQAPLLDQATFQNSTYPESWNSTIEALYLQPSSLTKVVYDSFYTSKSYLQVFQAAAVAVAQIGPGQPFPQSSDFELCYQKSGVESILCSLSELETLLLVAAARWVTRAESPQVNFKLAYNEYVNMMAALNVQATTLTSKLSYIDNMSLTGIKVTRTVFSNKVARDAWGSLYRSGLLVDVIVSSNEVNALNNNNIYREAVLDDAKMLQVDVTLEELLQFFPDGLQAKRLAKL